MSRTQRLLFWGCGLAVFLLLIHLLNDILTPFIAGLAVAYFLDPLADRLETKGCSRVIATLIITLGFFLIVACGLMLLFPLLKTQIISIAERVPDLMDLIESLSKQALAQVSTILPSDAMDQARGAATDYGDTLMGWGKKAVNSLWSSGMAVFGVISLMIITPIVSFFMLLEWDNIVARADHLLPRKQAGTIREQLGLIDQTISAFVRGQASVCLVLMIWYAITLSLIGLEAGLLIGIGAGLISFIPYVGATTGIAIGVGIAVVQFDTVSPIAMVAGVFLIGQIVESYVLTPRLVGDKVGLHDLWIMFALMAGGTLFGFTGVLLAVPCAAVIGVLIRFGISRYLKSAFYHGNTANEDKIT
ncbi:MAG: AI-2E family transporter [Rhodospirillales bacterium]|jgi:predicted PurR-regulated permease PerM|nr:AI-2E family transporter [Rhodospirillales bacterium]